MKIIDILCYVPETKSYEHYYAASSKSIKSIIDNDNNPTDKFYNFIINNIDEIKDKKMLRENIKAIVRDLNNCKRF